MLLKKKTRSRSVWTGGRGVNARRIKCSISYGLLRFVSKFKRRWFD